MSRFEIHTKDSAPEEAREFLEAAEKKFGFVPNLLGELAAAPPAVEAYLTLNRLLGETSLDPVEQQIVLATVSIANECDYCVAAHTAGLKMAGLPEDQVEALREGGRLDDPKLEALRTITTALVEERGHLDDGDLEAFLEAGYRKQQVLEVLVGVAMKTLSNYTNHIAETPLDEQLQPFAWEAATT